MSSAPVMLEMKWDPSTNGSGREPCHLTFYASAAILGPVATQARVDWFWFSLPDSSRKIANGGGPGCFPTLPRRDAGKRASPEGQPIAISTP